MRTTWLSLALAAGMAFAARGASADPQLSDLIRKEQAAFLMLKDLLGPDGRPDWLADEKIICVVVEDDPEFGWQDPSQAFLDLFANEMKKLGADDLTFAMGSACVKDPDMPQVMTFDGQLASYLVAEIESEDANGRSEWFVHGFNGGRVGGAIYELIDRGAELKFAVIKGYP